MGFCRKIVVIALSLLALAMAGCGGGASDLSGALTLSVAAPADSTQPGTATATYTASSGKNPIGVEISFSTDRPDLVALETGQRSVGTDGTASITFRTIAVQTDTTVRINASTGGLTTFQTLTLKGDANAPPPAPPSATLVPNTIQAGTITPSDGKLALKGTGTSVRPENGFITFKVIDQNNVVVPNQVVDFTVTPANNGGVTLTSASATTNTSGTVNVGISAGATQATVQITATLHSYPTIQATAQFSVTSGPPDQDSFTLSAQTLNSESFNIAGVRIPITVQLADHFNNPPPPGTAVLFTTTGGKILEGSGVTDASGNVTVTWESSEPWLSNGRFVIMARAVGEESFTDKNGNGLADPGEFTDTGFAFVDANGNGVYDAGEEYFPETSSAPYSAGDGLYNGMYQGAAYIGAPKTKTIFKNMVMVMSTSAAQITVLSPNPITGPGTIDFIVSDLNGNTMAAGTTISVTADNGKLGTTTSFTVPQNTGYGQTYSVPISSDGTPSAGSVTITVKSPGGLQTVKNILSSGI